MTDMGSYSAEYAAQYQSQSFETVLVGIRRARVLRSMFAYPHRRVLEVGCGLVPLFTDVTDADTFTIVEPSAEFADRATRLVAGRAGVHVVRGFLEAAAPALAGQTFDFIVVSSLLHEVPDPLALLGAVHALTTLDTVVHLNVPNMRSFHRLLALEMGLVPDVFEPSETERRFQRNTRFDEPALHQMVESAGFRVLESGSYFVKPFTHAQMDQLAEIGMLDQRMVRGLDAMTRYLPAHGAEIFVDMRRA